MKKLKRKLEEVGIIAFIASLCLALICLVFAPTALIITLIWAIIKWMS
jgi:hypothetical protein